MKKSLKSKSKKFQNSFIFNNFVRTRDIVNRFAKKGLLKTVLMFVLILFGMNYGTAQIQNYDLAFGEIDDCKMPQIDVKITDMDNPDWTVEYLQVYIKYTVTGAQGQGEFTIDKERTRYSLSSQFKHYYEPYNAYNDGEKVHFTESQDGHEGMIKIEGTLIAGVERQKLESMADLITIFFNKAPNSMVTDVEFAFQYVAPNNSEIELYDDQEVGHVCTPKNTNITKTYTFEPTEDDYDFAFGSVESEVDICDLKHVDVIIDECNNHTLQNKVLRIYIDYFAISGSIQIDENRTKEHLNDIFKNHYEPDGTDNNIVTINQQLHNIKIKAKLIDGNEAPTLDDIKRIITIYFTGGPSTHVIFKFNYLPTETEMLLQDEADCYISYPNQNSNNRTVDYTFAMNQNYDLAFGEIGYYNPVSGENCKENFVPVDVVNIDNPSWEIKSLKVYIKYDKDLDIDDYNTTGSVMQFIRDNYNYTINVQNGMTSLEAIVKENHPKITFDEIANRHLMKLFFSGNPGDIVNISFSYDDPASLMNTNDKNNEDDCITVYPKQDPNQNYNIQIDNYQFDGVHIYGLVSTLSNFEMKGRCNDTNNDGSNVDVMQDVTVNFYNMDKDPVTPYCVSVTDSYGEFGCDVSPDCTKRVVPEKEICNECGLTLLDIQKTRKVILGVEKFKNSYQPFVADMNNNGVVTSLDLVYIEKIILNIPSALTGYTDFRFIPSDIFIQFQNQGDYGVLVPDYDPYIEFDDPPYFLGFFAFKTGDVVKDDPNSNDLGCDHCNPDCYHEGKGDRGGKSKMRANKELNMNVKDNGDYISITGSAAGKDSFDIIGAEIQIKPIGLNIDTVLFYDMEKIMPGYHYDKESGILKLIWINKNAYTTNKSSDDKLFKIVLKKGKYTMENLAFSLVENNSLNYSIKVNDQVYNTVLDEKLEQIEDEKNEFNIFPTVIDDRIFINYYSPKETTAILRLYDLKGITLVNKEFSAIRGNSSTVIKDLRNLPTGIVFYKVVIGDKIYTGKLIKSDKSSNSHLK